MVRRGTRAGNRVRFDTKDALLAGGADVRALRYQRASQDKKEQGKSVGDQGKLNLAEITKRSWKDAGSFTDNHRSASRHATKEREQFELLIEQIRAGKGDVLVIWEISRKERDLAVYVRIRDMCTEVGLYFWLVGGVLYDLRDKNDRMMLGFQAVQAEWLADSIRDNVLRGIVGAAEAGRPHGKVTYGYRRIYDQRTKALLRQEPDTEIRKAVGADETVTEYSHAGVVRDNFTKVAAGVPLITIEDELNAKGIPSPQGSTWRRGIIRKQVLNPAYIGKRVFRGEIVGDGIWPALVDEDTYWACVRLLEDPSRTTTRAGRAVHLLSYIVACGVCGGPISSGHVSRHGWEGQVYSCLKKRCAAVKAEFLDEYVQRTVVAWLSLPETGEMLSALSGGDEQAAHARAEAARLRAELEDWRKLGEEGEVSAIAYARAEKGLTAQIAEHEARAKEAGIPPVLRGMIGEHAARRWAELGDEVAVKREIIRTVADIKLLRAGKGSRQPFGAHRLEWTWRFGPDAEQDAA
ncbi:recombinase family protein [Micromonospora sp. WMMD1082]|uniref:recombinase family protein n=1 Tax=Micromonospora sp. WMMD1082 TaxID=3016104 RepID=UPI0024159E59|nr:recombinase family protein [Micromonospora sp. WMMD1082]MDG4798811.1 recombinase family protein [Micromonospora sp. WMMD1082]